MSELLYDIAIIGGGINGCGLARDAAGRGMRIFLCEQDDLGSGTSSASTKLIHGGLRYLEHLEFRLVRELLIEREVLWAIAPHIIRPLRLVLPYHKGLRPSWMLRLGLFIYDHLGGRGHLSPTRVVDLARDPVGLSLKREKFVRGFEYSDCWGDDARLVVLNARDAADRGAAIATRTRLISGERRGAIWHLQLETSDGNQRTAIAAKTVINAAGPWVEGVHRALDVRADAKVRLVQGSHIVVPKLFDHESGYIFQNADGRVLFALPFERDFTLIGTTDQDYVGDPGSAKASAGEIAYLVAAASDYFARPLTPDVVVWAYSGVRALFNDGAEMPQTASRDYVLSLDAPAEAAPLLSIFGGKLTTYRRIAEQALAKLRMRLPGLRRNAGWTARSPLPGGDFPTGGFDACIAALRAGHPWLDPSLAHRLIRLYGTRAERIVGGATRMADLGRVFGADMSAREVDYLISHEWARTSDDVLWRRSKLGLRMNPGDIAELKNYMEGAVRAERPHSMGAA